VAAVSSVIVKYRVHTSGYTYLKRCGKLVSRVDHKDYNNTIALHLSQQTARKGAAR
jgi:hypothetical protein